MKYIYEHDGFPAFTWNEPDITNALTAVAGAQGRIIGKMLQFGFGTQQEAMLDAMTKEIVASSEIEGELLNSGQVRSSLAHRLNIVIQPAPTPSHYIDGIVEAMLDATEKYQKTLTKTRLCGWHAALFPTGWSGMRKIRVGQFRKGEMQVVSTKGNRNIVHYEAPAPQDVARQMDIFLDWFNKNNNVNALLKSAIAHLWFVIIHPFDDGNGRITRIITEMLLARSENTHLRFYSMSAQIQKEKKIYYQVLEQTTLSNLDITDWLVWFFECLGRSIEKSAEITANVIRKAVFWQKNACLINNKIQQDIINRLFDGFEGNMTSGKAGKIFKVSQDTAARLLKDLADKDFLEIRGGGRSTHYALK